MWVGDGKNKCWSNTRLEYIMLLKLPVILSGSVAGKLK